MGFPIFTTTLYLYIYQKKYYYIGQKKLTELCAPQTHIDQNTRFEEQWLRIKFWVYTKNIQNDLRSHAIISTADDIAVANDEHELPFIVVVEGSEGVDHVAQRIITFGVTQYLAEDKFI